MDSLANGLYKILLGWLQTVASAVWSAFTSENGNSFLNWIGRNWIVLAGVLCVIGLAADLCVYILRWKPFKVWKSFFARREQAAADTDEDRPEAGMPRNGYFAPRETMKQTEVRNINRPAETGNPDFSRWEDEPEEKASPPEPRVTDQTVVTKAGYVIPEDSPYRRPSEQRRPAAPDPEEYRPARQETEEADEPQPVVPRRRRRLNVGSLFSDPEEELYPFDAPQNVIDRNKAYHEQVYPRGWKNGEDSSQ